MASITWAVTNGVKPTFVVPGAWGSRLDPSATNGVTAKMGLDATVPPGALENEFRSLVIPGADEVDVENL